MDSKHVECPVCSGNGCNACDGEGEVEQGSLVDKAFDDDSDHNDIDEK